MATKPKKWYLSKTIILGGITILIGILSYIQANPELGGMAILIGSLNIINRFLTTSPIE